MTNKVMIEDVLEMMRKEQQETNRNKRGGSKGEQSSYAKLKMQLEDTQRMKLVGENELVKVQSAHWFGGSAHWAAGDSNPHLTQTLTLTLTLTLT